MRRWGWGLALVLLLEPGVAVAQVTSSHHHFALVGATSAVTVRPSRTNRVFLELLNDSTNSIYCTVDGTTTPTASDGIRLQATAGRSDRAVFDRNVPTAVISCISDTGQNRLLILESYK